MVRALLEWFPVLAMPGFAFGFGFGPQGGRNNANSGGGPFLLLFDATSKLLLSNGSSRLLITGTNPAGAFVPTFYLLGF